MIARLLVAVLAGATALPSVAAAAPLAGPSIIKRLNAERSRLGLPARVREVPEWSARCALHNRWMALNGLAQHNEIEGTAGYSEGGRWAGMNSVLAEGTDWRHGNPWTAAPIHLIQLLDPDLRRAGASDAYEASCVTTWPGMKESSAERVWTVPRDGGRVAVSERAFEAPFTPQERVGITADETTGPYLYVWSDGLGELVRGSLTGPGPRAVAVKVIDDADVDGAAGIGNGWLLPVRPLKARTRYTATVTLAGDAEDLTYSWAFTTGSAPTRTWSVRRSPSTP
jgi:hypothetical protein